ncbi:MAG: helix-hairpin-helix domain-containing protein [Lachnospiraceae bacterium]|nr:helix-hairpin-helix domain-containing protein [Lachnospiraceae bacterium]
MKKCKMVILITICFMLMAAVCACEKESEDIVVSTEDRSEQETEESPSDSAIQIYICGEVKHPGVYQFDRDARIISAIEAAGGLTKEAASEGINQAQKMEDGQQIYVPSRTEQQKMSTEKPGKDSGGLISINQATKEEFMTLPGIGEAKADSIISYREEHGSFQSTEDLMKISGIKEGVYNKIKDYITL